MATQNPSLKKNSLYPEVIQSNPETSKIPNSSSSTNLYPSLDMRHLDENIFPDPVPDNLHSPSAPPQSAEEVLIKVPGAILHLIDQQYSVELACGDLTIVRLLQGDRIVAVLVRIGDEIQWPLMKDEAVVKLDESHYFFTLRFSKEQDSDSSDEEVGKKINNETDNLLNYGLTIASKGQERLLNELDGILQSHSSFSVQKVSEKARDVEVLDGSIAKDISPSDLKSGKKKDLMEKRCQAYWTTLAPNVEDYSSSAGRLIAAGSGHLVKGILWCGDVTIDRLQWGNEVMKKRMAPGSKSEISPQTLKRIRRVKRMTKTTEKVATGVLSGVIKVSGFFTSSVANSKLAKKFFSLLPGEMVLASLDGFNKVCDAAEVSGRHVMSTSSSVTTGLVNHKYGEEAAHATNEGLNAAGHAMGTAWAVFKIRNALNPKSVVKPSALVKSAAKAAAAESKAKKKSSN